MAYLVGVVSNKELDTLIERGWDIEIPPLALIDTDHYDVQGVSKDGNSNMIMIFVDSDMFAIMSGPDWEK